MPTFAILDRRTDDDVVQHKFLTVLPRIQTHACIYFRFLKCPDKKQDAIQETIALAWKWFARLALLGKDGAEFPSVLATLAARAVWSGRRLCGQEKAHDVMSSTAQRRHGFVVEKLPERTSSCRTLYHEALRDNMQTPVPDQVSFRCDFPAWLRTRCDRDRRIVQDLMVGERTLDVANKFGITPARVAQLRREFHDDWEQFCSDAVEADPVSRI